MPYPRCRFIYNAMARPVQAERYVHILEISPEFLGKGTHVQKCLTAIEGAGGADAENFAALEIVSAEGLAVAAFTGDAAEKIAIAGAIDY